MLGAESFRKEVLPNTDLLKVDISGFPKGIYVVNISDVDRKKIVSKKVIIE